MQEPDCVADADSGRSMAPIGAQAILIYWGATVRRTRKEKRDLGQPGGRPPTLRWHAERERGKKKSLHELKARCGK